MCSLIFHFERSLFEVAGRLWLVWVWRLDLSEIWKLPLLKFKDALLQNEPSAWQKLGPERILVPGLHWRARQAQLMTSSGSTEWWPWAGEAPKEARIVFLVFNGIQRFFQRLDFKMSWFHLEQGFMLILPPFHLHLIQVQECTHSNHAERWNRSNDQKNPPRFLWSRFSCLAFCTLFP